MDTAALAAVASLRLTALSRTAALLVAAAALIALTGWAIGNPLLKSVLPGAVEMKVNTAAGLLLGSIALFLLSRAPSPRQRYAALIIGALVCAIGAATLGEYLFGWRLGIDELLFRDTAKTYSAIPGRMSPYSAVTFIAIGAAVAALASPRLRALLWPSAIIVIGIGALSFIGYLWNASELVTDRWLPPVAVNTAVAFLLLGGGFVLADPQRLLAQRGARIRLSSVEIKTLSGFAAALLLLLVVGGYTYQANVRLAGTAEWVAHTQQVRAALARLYLTIMDAQSAQRDYLLTGERFHRDDYQHRVADADSRINALAVLIADNPVQARNLEALKPLVAERFGRLDQGVRLYEARGFAAVREFIATGRGIDAMQRVRAAIDQMDALEAGLLEQRTADFAGIRQRSLVSLILTQTLATVFLLVLFFRIRGEILGRERLARQLQTAHREVVRANSQLTDANKELEAFSYSVSHDLRAPLRAINGFIQMLEEDTRGQLAAEPQRYLRVIHESSRKMGQLIDDLLAFSRVGRAEMRKTEVELDALVRGVIAGLAVTTAGRNIEWDIGPLPAVQGDPALLRQVFSNLIGNAIKYSRHRDPARIEIGVAEATGDDVTLYVRDNGAGFDMRYVHKLFGVFQRLHTAEEFEGTGVGLALVQRIVVRHGGRVWAEGAPGQGATFHFTLCSVSRPPDDARPNVT